MKKITVFLAVLLLLMLPINAFAEESDVSSVTEETKVEKYLRESLTLVPKGSVLLIGGDASALWRDFVFDMYPANAKKLTVESTKASDWITGIHYLSIYSPKAVVFCIDGNDNTEDVLLLVQGVLENISGASVYMVSAFSGKNTAELNQSVSELCASYARAEFLDIYSKMVLEDGTPDPKYISDKLTAEGIRFMGKAVSAEINGETQVIAPEVSVPDTDESDTEPVEQKKERSYRWLVPVAILAGGLLLGYEFSRNENYEEKFRRKNKK